VTPTEPRLIWRKRIADTETPVSAALKLFQPERGDFILESVEGGETRGRHSLIGIAPDLVFRAQGERAEINRQWLTDRTAFAVEERPTLEALRALVMQCRMDVPEELPPALACLVGYFGYETIGLVEKLPRAQQSELALPDMLFVRPTVILVFDRLKDEMFLVAPVWNGELSAFTAAEERLDGAERLLDKAVDKPVANTKAADRVIAPHPVLPSGHYREMVCRAKDYIAAGDIFQVVLAQRFTAPFALPPVDLYRALRRILVRARAGEVTIRPIAGTRPRGKTSIEDAENRASLLADPKERSEHLMLLDLGRNDVGRVTRGGSVTVTDSYMVEFYSHVMHIVSNVVGELAPDKDAIDALLAGFPAGTVSGAPKLRACEIIAELEPETRGAYAGGVGYFSPNGDMDSCIVLRTGIVKDGVLHVQAGAGIVADSDPDYEQRECEAKAGALIAAAREAYKVAGEAGFGQ
jgi:anthranilate synthase component I